MVLLLLLLLPKARQVSITASYRLGLEGTVSPQWVKSELWWGSRGQALERSRNFAFYGTQPRQESILISRVMHPRSQENFPRESADNSNLSFSFVGPGFTKKTHPFLLHTYIHTYVSNCLYRGPPTT